MGVKAGMPSAKMSGKANYNSKDESVNAGFSVGACLGVGATIDVNVKLHNPINSSVRKKMASGNVVSMAAGAAEAYVNVITTPISALGSLTSWW